MAEEAFSYSIQERGNEVVFKAEIVGPKQEWLPLLEQAIEHEFNENLWEEIKSSLKDLSKVYEKPAIITFTATNHTEKVLPDNPIGSIEEIPEVISGTELVVIKMSGVIKRKRKEVVFLGEHHIATKEEEHAASRIIPYFDSLGCEGVQLNDFIEGRIFSWVIKSIVNPVLNYVAYFGKRSGKNVTPIHQAKTYESVLKKDNKVVALEKGWRPGFRARALFVLVPSYVAWSILTFTSGVVESPGDFNIWNVVIQIASIALFVRLSKVPVVRDVVDFIFGTVILGVIFGIKFSRERNKAKNIIAHLKDNNNTNNMLVLTGAAHTKSIAKILEKKYGFVREGF